MHPSAIAAGSSITRVRPSTHLRRSLLLSLLLLACAAGRAGATVNAYLFAVTSSKPVDMSGAKQVKIANDMTVGPFDMGFTFNYDGTDYSAFSISSNGLLGFGKGPVTSASDNTGSPDIACLMPFWESFTINAVYFQVSGSSPNRVLTVQWDAAPIATKGSMTMQVRLYEGTNVIEFYYGSSLGKSWTGTVGLWVDGGNFATISTSSNTFNYLKRDDASFPPPEGTVYSFTPNLCSYTFTGNVAQGGTATMSDGDVLLQGVSAAIDRNTTRQPFTVAKSISCGTKAVTFALSGPAKGDYSIAASAAFPATPTITFTPKAVGVHTATLTVTAGSVVRTYQLAAVGTSRIALNGDPAQGGTTPLKSGDTLLQPLFVNLGSCDSRSPLVLQNVGLTTSSATMTISGSSEYSLLSNKVSVDPGKSVAPEIRFCPSDTARRPALLTILTEDGETTQYLLYAFGRYRAIRMTIDGVPADPSTATFVNQSLCVGADLTTIAVDLTAYGDVPVNVNAIRFYEADTTVRQGSPAYPLRADSRGRAIPMSDYIVTADPALLPVASNAPVSWPVVVPGGGTTRLYVTFIASRPGKRFGRAFIETDAINLSNAGPDGSSTLGLLRFDLYGRGLGAVLSDDASGTAPHSVFFGASALGAEITRWVRIENPGVCELRIAAADLAPSAGDIHEFRIDSIPKSWVLDADGRNYLLAPGAADSIRVAFQPAHLGTRRASILLRTNDSTINLPGNRRGEYYLDVEGVGGDALYASGVNLGSGLIDDATGPYSKEKIRLTNGTGVTHAIIGVVMLGADAANFQLTGSSPVGVSIEPGMSADQEVEFRPVGGLPGERVVEIGWILENGDTVRSTVRGTAGTRVVAANPTALTFPATRIGRPTRKAVQITNQGTLPVKLQVPVVGGTNASFFSVGTLPRLELAPGQTELLEITFAPGNTGAAVGDVTIGTDAPGGSIVITLNGSGTKARYRDDEDPAGAVIGERGERDRIEGDGAELGVAGVSRRGEVAGVQVVPNPVRGDVVRVRFEGSGIVAAELYDAAGRAVESEVVQTSGGEVVLRVQGFSSGRYTLRLRVGEKTSERTVLIEH